MARRGFKPCFRRCDVCGKIYTQKTAKQIRCADCQKVYTAKKSKERKDLKLKRTDYSAWLEKHDPNVCRKVKKCIYGAFGGGIWTCDYMQITGKRRPCPVKDCTEFEERK